MKSIQQALLSSNLTDIQVTTPHSLAILPPLSSPSAGHFDPAYDRSFFTPLLEFHRKTKSPFMVNPYPYFGYNKSDLNFAIFKKNDGILDKGSKLKYYNMFDYLLDGVYSAMKKSGYDDVDIAVGETGWPSAGDPNEPDANVDNAVSYNSGLIQHVSSGKGTPLMHNRTFEVYIFALFNENQKPGTSEKNYGLFKPDFTKVYDVGVLKSPSQAPTSTPSTSPAPTTSPSATSPTPSPTSPPATSSALSPTPTAAPSAASSNSSSGSWCVPKKGVSTAQLQANLNYACGQAGVDCSKIRAGGSCYNPDTVASHAAYAMNLLYQKEGRSPQSCDFTHTATVTSTNPSYGSCVYPSDVKTVLSPSPGVGMYKSLATRVNYSRLWFWLWCLCFPFFFLY